MPTRIGFKSGEAEYVREEEVPKKTESTSLMDTETIPRLEEYKAQLQTDPLAQTVLDSYIQLYAMGMIDITFDELTGEPVAELIKNTVPQFNIKTPSLHKEEGTVRESKKKNKPN